MAEQPALDAHVCERMVRVKGEDRLAEARRRRRAHDASASAEAEAPVLAWRPVWQRRPLEDVRAGEAHAEAATDHPYLQLLLREKLNQNLILVRSNPGTI